MHDEEKKHSMISLTPLSHTTDTTEQHIAKTVDPNDSPANDGKHITNNKQSSTTVKQESSCHLTAHDDSTERMIAKQAEQSRSNTSIDINAANMLQDDATIGTAATAAVETTELFESILSRLPTLDLLKARRVSKTFQELLKSSPTLQRKLFLLPESQPAQFWQVGKGSLDGHTYMTPVQSDENTGVVPLLDPTLTVPRDAFGKGRVATWCPHNRQPGPVPVREHDLGRIVRSYSLSDRLIRQGHETVGFSQQVSGSAYWNCFSASMAEAELWASMYLTNPPCTKAMISATYGDATGCEISFEVDRRIKRDYGLMMTSIWEAVHQKGPIHVMPQAFRSYAVSLNFEGRVLVTSYGEYRHEPWPFQTRTVETTVRELIDAFERIGISVSFSKGQGTHLDLYDVILPTEEETREMQEKGRVTSPHRSIRQR